MRGWWDMGSLNIAHVLMAINQSYVLTALSDLCWHFMCVDICMTVIYDGSVRLSDQVLMLAREHVPKTRVSRGHISLSIASKQESGQTSSRTFPGVHNCT